MKWADKYRKLSYSHECRHAGRREACSRVSVPEGIGLCRTEHMFFQEDRIAAMREMILADD
jgi:pyruvate,orthophosphate dikinase